MELHSAVTGKVTSLGEAVIYNDGTGSDSLGNYVAEFGKKGQTFQQAHSRPWKFAEVKGFPRKRLLAWDLLQRALTAALGDRKA